MRSPAAIYHGGSEKQQLQQQQPHFLDSCFLCQRQLAHNSDIFMYRGNTPFCSQECRQEQIEIDDASERRRKPSSSSSRRQSNSTSRNSAESKKESNTNKAAARAGVVVVA